jgi:hypothetical protein
VRLAPLQREVEGRHVSLPGIATPMDLSLMSGGHQLR